MGGPRLRPEIESLPAYKAGQAPIERTDITTFKISSNESPFEPPDRVREAIERAARQVHRYPDPFSRRLVAALAQRFDVASDQIALGTCCGRQRARVIRWSTRGAASRPIPSGCR